MEPLLLKLTDWCIGVANLLDFWFILFVIPTEYYKKMLNIQNPQTSVLVTYRQGYLHKKENEKKVNLLFDNSNCILLRLLSL